MNELFPSIGFSNVKTKKDERKLCDWVLERPDRFRVVNHPDGRYIGVAEREIGGQAMLVVVGETDDNGEIQPDYCFPYIQTAQSVNDASKMQIPIDYEPLSYRDGFSGICDGFPTGGSLVFQVKNIADAYVEEVKTGGEPGAFSDAVISMLVSDATVILPLPVGKKEKVIGAGGIADMFLEKGKLPTPEELTQIAEKEAKRYERAFKRAQNEDILSVVESFFMPYGVEADRYYFMGTIEARGLFMNVLTGEKFYRMVVQANEVRFTMAVNELDLLGVPEVGYRIKGHGVLLGELKK